MLLGESDFCMISFWGRGWGSFFNGKRKPKFAPEAKFNCASLMLALDSVMRHST
jgi:hypothetical protein